MASYLSGRRLRPPSEFLWFPKKLRKQRLIFDTHRVNQHFRRPWHFVLPTPAFWAGLQLPADSAYHMAQTDLNTALYRILAPTGMPEHFILPRVSTHLLLREGVEVPNHLRHLSDVFPQLQVLAMGFSWALYFCQKWWRVVYGHLVFRRTRCSWIVTGHRR